MSKYNKANKNHYTQAGRLTPDEMGRERQKQAEISAGAKGKERVAPNAPTAESPPEQERQDEGHPAADEQAPSRPGSGREE